MARAVLFSDAASRDFEHIKAWLTQPGAGKSAAAKLLNLLETIAELPETAMRHPIDPDRPSHRYVAQHGYWIRFRIRRDFIFVSRLFGPGQNRR